MKQINLRELYPDTYTEDTLVEVSDEVMEVFLDDRRAEALYQRQKYNYKANYSLDQDNGIEKSIIQHQLPPEELLMEKELRERLHSAVMTLPKKQAKRICSRYFFGMTVKEIAQQEGIDPSMVYRSIRYGLLTLRKNFEKN